MKKLATLAALAALALPVIATEVTSSNVVGYQKLTLKPGFNMVPNSLVEIGSEEIIPIADMFGGDENATANRNADIADRIDVWDSTLQTYVSYFRMTNRQGTSVWWGRYDSTNVETEDAFPAVGAGAFYYNQAANDLVLTVSGQVKSTSTTWTIRPGFNLLCNPYPIDLAISGNTVDWSSAVANRNADIADRIDTWDATAQTYVSYFRMTNRQGTSVWWGRYDSTNVATEDSIPANQAFFYYSQASEPWTATIASPVAGN